MAGPKHVHRTDSQAELFMETHSGQYLQDYIVINILSRLPAKSLLRFETVSKAWLSMISNPTFVDLHLRHASQNNDSLLVHSVRGRSFNSVSLSSVDSSIDISYFEGDLNLDMYIVGSYNGIVCAAVLENLRKVIRDRRLRFTSNDFTLPRKIVHTFLWNPATKQSKLLPFHGLLNFVVCVGFGFDPIANDYKVVKITEEQDAMVYSANTNAWKEIESPTIFPCNFIADSCAKGVLYWTWTDGMIRFDLNKEVFYYHRFPANVQNSIHRLHVHRHSMRIIEMKDCNDVAMCSYDGGTENKVNLWALNCGFEGFEGSWTLKFSFDVPPGVNWLHGNLNNRGDILFKTIDGVWMLYNSDKKATELSRFQMVQVKRSSILRAYFQLEDSNNSAKCWRG